MKEMNGRIGASGDTHRKWKGMLRKGRAVERNE